MHIPGVIVEFLVKKSDVLEAFKKFKARAENPTGKRIKYLQSDNDTDYVNLEFDEYLKAYGIGRRLTIPHNPQQHGIAERKNRTLVDTAIIQSTCVLLSKYEL